MQVQENFSLRAYNSFGIDAAARYFASFQHTEELSELLAQAVRTPNGDRIPVMILGGGSNLLLASDIDGLVLRNAIRGIEQAGEDDDSVLLKVGAGENWHQFVLYCISNNLGGVENLSLIPGCVGASPMQNIGAYGVEIKDVFHELTAFHLEEKCNYTFRSKDAGFGYRESVFKNKYRGQFAITDVTFRLLKRPVFHTSYGAIEKELESMGVKELSIRAISDAVIRIRQSKLPDPAVIGNAGSFFKNPSVPKDKYQSLREIFPAIVGYENPDGSVKLAAGWLIEQCGWKGYRRGDAGCHASQALVLVNYGSASGEDIYQLSTDIQSSVREKFGVELEREVNKWPIRD